MRRIELAIIVASSTLVMESEKVDRSFARRAAHCSKLLPSPTPSPSPSRNRCHSLLTSRNILIISGCNRPGSPTWTA